MKNKNNVRILTESSISVAVASILSLIVLFRMPLGGAVTPFSTLPIILISLRHGERWGALTALSFSLIQLLLGLSSVTAVPAKTFWSMFGCAMLDYVLAYSFLGFTCVVARGIKSNSFGAVAGIAVTGALRLLCSFLSGIIIWAPYTPQGWSVALYSLVYNASWCIPDVAITVFVCLIIIQIPGLGLNNIPKDKE